MDQILWKPTKTDIIQSNIYKMMHKFGFSSYQNFWQWSVNYKATFWEETITNLNIPFVKKYTVVLDTSNGVENATWLKNAKLNIVDACFTHEDEAIAITYQNTNGKIQTVTYKQLKKLVNKIANSFVENGLKLGDKIAVLMPMTVEAVAVYLAGIKAGMPIVTIADSFTPNEIDIRLKITAPKLLITQNSFKRGDKTISLYSKVKSTNAPKSIVINCFNDEVLLRENDILWEHFLSEDNNFKAAPQNPEDTITVLFSSGTTGEPKAIPWNHTTPIKSASDAYYHHNIKENDVLCWPTNLGWMMGPWLVFSALINKATIALYYGAPTEQNFGAFVQNAKVTMLGVIPSFVKNWKATGCMEEFDWSAIKCFSSTGEVSNPTEMEYLSKLANTKPIIEYCGGTEIGGGYVTSTVVQPNMASTFSTQALGGEFVLLNEAHKNANKGEVFIIPPIVGLSNKLLNRDHFSVYYKNAPTYNNQTLRRHGDELLQLKNGYYKAQGRVDDAMNLGGIKISSVQIETVLNNLPFVKEAAAIAVSPKIGGPSQLVVYYVPLTSKKLATEKFSEAKNVIKQQLNPLFKLTDFIEIETLPRTASNKIMRRKLRDLYQNN